MALQQRFLLSKGEKASLKLYFRAALALYGSILFWVGAWDLTSVQRKSDGSSVDGLVGDDPTSLGLLLLFGAALVFASETVFGNAGMEVQLATNKGFSIAARFWETHKRSNTVHAIRCTLAMVGMVAVWVAQYELIDYYLGDDGTSKWVGCVMGGLGGLLLTGTFYNMCYLYPSNLTDTVVTTWRGWALAMARSWASMISQNCLWIGVFNSVEGTAETPWQHLFYASIGLCALLATSSFVANSWIDLPDSHGGHCPSCACEDAEDDESACHDLLSTQSTIAFKLRALLSLAGQVLHNAAVWNLMDIVLLGDEDTVWRNGTYVLVGTAMLLGSHTFEINWGVRPRDMPTILEETVTGLPPPSLRMAHDAVPNILSGLWPGAMQTSDAADDDSGDSDLNELPLIEIPACGPKLAAHPGQPISSDWLGAAPPSACTVIAVNPLLHGADPADTDDIPSSLESTA